ncbi:6017_t:CDS:2, partial [Funneliformis mosseae]
MVFKFNANKSYKDLENKIKELEQSKRKSDEENQLLLSFLLNELGINFNDLDNLRELLAGQKITEILAKFENIRQENLNLTAKIEKFSNLNSQFKYLERKFNEHEEKAKAKQKTIIKVREEQTKETIKIFEETIKEQKESKAQQETINALKEK